jgi:hypothetical protein
MPVMMDMNARLFFITALTGILILFSFLIVTDFYEESGNGTVYNTDSPISITEIHELAFRSNGNDTNNSAPILYEPSVYIDEGFVVFDVYYEDADGDEGEVLLYLDDDVMIIMEEADGEPLTGQLFEAYVSSEGITIDTEFSFEAEDIHGANYYFEDFDNDAMFEVGDFDDLSGLAANVGDGEEDSTENNDWLTPEVIVGLIAILGALGGSIIGMYFRKKKRGRFSERLNQVDDVYSSFKSHPRKCETELEKLKTEIDGDLKNDAIDDNNYSILKERIDDIKREIRSEQLSAKAGSLPKELELMIKDMLIDGKISRTEYDKFMTEMKSSDMDSGDKKAVEKMVKSWMKSE